MDPQHTEMLGARHGQQLMRGLDRFAGLPFALSPGMAEPAPRTATSGRFGRIFDPSNYNPTDAAVHELAQTMIEPDDTSAGDNPSLPIGFTFLGQFIDHDLTLDATTLFGQIQDPQAITDFRNPNFDLDNLYGAGPGVSRHMYDTSGAYGKNPVKLLLDANREFDLPRNSQNSALIGDLRNDENFLVSQLHLAFVKFHNAVVDWIFQSNPAKYQGLHGNMMLFADAQDAVRRHYQWIVLNDFLPKVVGPAVIYDVMTNGLKIYKFDISKEYPFMPVEFSVAAYRLGHTLLRKNYVINSLVSKTLFELPVFGSPQIHSVLEKIDFTRFFDFPGRPAAQKSRKFDAKITMPVFMLPFIDPVQDPPVSLAERNMLRSKVFQLPSGQEVATKLQNMGLVHRVYTNQDLGISAIPGLDGGAPLWFYILKESELTTNGLTLGAVGSRIVAEVFIGLLSGIPGNYLHDDPNWQPVLPSAHAGAFTMVDLLTFAQA